MNAEFNWWLLIVGLVVGAGLVWLVVADTRRREADVADREREGEARWIASAMTDAGRAVDDDIADLDAVPRRAFSLRGSAAGEGLASERIDDDARTALDDRRWIAVSESKTSPEPGVNRR